MYIYYHYYYEMRRLDQMRRPRGAMFYERCVAGGTFFLNKTSLGACHVSWNVKYPPSLVNFWLLMRISNQKFWLVNMLLRMLSKHQSFYYLTLSFMFLVMCVIIYLVCNSILTHLFTNFT